MSAGERKEVTSRAVALAGGVCASDSNGSSSSSHIRLLAHMFTGTSTTSGSGTQRLCYTGMADSRAEWSHEDISQCENATAPLSSRAYSRPFEFERANIADTYPDSEKGHCIVRPSHNSPHAHPTQQPHPTPDLALREAPCPHPSKSYKLREASVGPMCCWARGCSARSSKRRRDSPLAVGPSLRPRPHGLVPTAGARLAQLCAALQPCRPVSGPMRRCPHTPWTTAPPPAPSARDRHGYRSGARSHIQHQVAGEPPVFPRRTRTRAPPLSASAIIPPFAVKRKPPSRRHHSADGTTPIATSSGRERGRGRGRERRRGGERVRSSNASERDGRRAWRAR